MVFGLQEDSKNNFTYKSSSRKECPEGSVPILEISREIVESFGSVREFLNRRGRGRKRSGVHTDDAVLSDGNVHEVCYYLCFFNGGSDLWVWLFNKTLQIFLFFLASISDERALLF